MIAICYNLILYKYKLLQLRCIEVSGQHMARKTYFQNIMNKHFKFIFCNKKAFDPPEIHCMSSFIYEWHNLRAFGDIMVLFHKLARALLFA